MALVVKPNTFSSGGTIVAGEHNDNFDTIYNDYNGNITNANVAAGAAIADTKLAQITTGSKVNLSAVIITGQAQGDVIYASDATALTRLAKGAASEVLSMNSGATAPEWRAGGSVVQTEYSSIGVISGAIGTAIALSDAIPQITEGGPVLIRSITPTSATNSLRIDVVIQASDDAAGAPIIALFQDATANALAAAARHNGVANSLSTVSLSHVMRAGTTSSTQFRVNLGTTSSNAYMNGNAASQRFGGRCRSSMIITEYIP